MAGSVDTLVHGGQVVTPSGVLDTGIAIDRGRIVALGAPEWLPSARGEIDARGKVVLPGGIDCHVHLGPEYDDLGGEPLPVAIRRLQAEIGRESVLDVGLHMILANQPAILDGLAEAVQLGVTSFKLDR